MRKRILLGIDLNISPATSYALRTISEFIEQTTSECHLVLLHVIPVPYVASPSLGMYVSSPLSLSVTPEQRTQAEDMLRRVRTELQKRGLASDQIEVLIRIGLPADEILKVARELQVSFIVIGSRGDSFFHKVRRFLTGSISRRVLQRAPCPVMIAVPPHVPAPADLVAWYEKAIAAYLREHVTLTVFTPREVARQFLPPNKKTPGRKEIAAATLALERLADSGVLCRHDVQGEPRYVND